MNEKNTQTDINKIKRNERTKEFLLNYALYFILGIMIVGMIAYEPSFLSVKNFTNILTQASTRGKSSPN